jgi:hypothetical protein
MNLFLDDVRACPQGWIPVRTAADFRRVILDYDWDRISFDHDLADGHYPWATEEEKRESAKEETGYDLLKWMFASGRIPRYKPTCIPPTRWSRPDAGLYRGALDS